MADLDRGPVEVLVLGELMVREDGCVRSPFPPTLAQTLTILAVSGGMLAARDLKHATGWNPSEGSIQQYVSKLKNLHGVPIVSSGPRGRVEYGLDETRCRIDAQEFIRGVAENRPPDELLRLWRDPLDDGVLDSAPWKAVRRARLELIHRIAGLPEGKQAALAGLARFADLFPADPDVHPIRLRGPGSLPRLLVVEDDPNMMKEISGRLRPDYRITPITCLKEWWDLRDARSKLEQIDGALVDLHLTERMDDRRGIEIVMYLCDHTEIPAALVTANGLERSSFGHQARMAEFRLVDIVDKKNNDWWEALATAARLLTGTGPAERRRRLETWLETAYRKLRRETEDASPGSVGARRRRAGDEDYGRILSMVRVGDIDKADREVTRFCRVSL